MLTCINLQHKKLDRIFGYVLEYYGPGGRCKEFRSRKQNIKDKRQKSKDKSVGIISTFMTLS
jgi:hypothetical protein